MIRVADDKGERRAERPAVPKAGEHLHLVGLDLLARAAPVALLAAPQIGVDRLAVENETRRQAGDDGDEGGPVRFAGSNDVQGAHASERTARRITSTGAAWPVQSSNEAAPCATRTSRPVTTAAPAPAAARAVAVSG